MRVHIGGDHAAFDLHQDLLAFLAQDDYPVFVLRVAEAVRDDPESLGIVLGGSGNGEQIAANKVSGIRAALCLTPEFANLARQHNNARVVALGGRFTARRRRVRSSPSSSRPRSRVRPGTSAASTCSTPMRPTAPCPLFPERLGCRPRVRVRR